MQQRQRHFPVDDVVLGHEHPRTGVALAQFGVGLCRRLFAGKGSAYFPGNLVRFA
jgi:hypothetical protein